MTKDSDTLERFALEIEKRRMERDEGKRRIRILRRLVRKFVMICAVVFLAGSAIFLFNFFRLNAHLIDGHIKSGVIPNITKGRFPLEMDSISGNLLYGVNISNVIVRNPNFAQGGVILAIPEISLEYSLIDVFFGNLVMRKVSLVNPVVTLLRDKSGNASWDFTQSAEEISDLAAKQNVSADPPASKKVKKNADHWLRAEQAQALADRYLSHIDVKNLTILSGNLREIVGDKAIAHFLCLPGKGMNLSGINVSLRKYPESTFVSHVLKVSNNTDPSLLTIDVSRMRKTGDFTMNLDFCRNQIVFAVRNMGAGGRKIVLFDGRNKDRLNLSFVIARNFRRIINGIFGLNGRINIADLGGFFSLFSMKRPLSGNLEMNFEASDDENILETGMKMVLRNGAIRAHGVPNITGIDLKIHTSNRSLFIENFAAEVSGFPATFTGLIDFRDMASITADFAADISGDEIRASAGYYRISPRIRRFDGEVTRNAGKLHVAFNRNEKYGFVRYDDIEINARINPEGSLWSVIPSSLIRGSEGENVKSISDRLDIIGPIRIEALISNPASLLANKLHLLLDGAVLVSRIKKGHQVKLGGEMMISSSTVDFKSLKMAMDSLSIAVDGAVDLDSESRSLTGYRLSASANLDKTGSFRLSAADLYETLGSEKPAAFDELKLEGDNIASGIMDSENSVHRLEMTCRKLGIKQKGLSLILDKFRLVANGESASASTPCLPRSISMKTDFEITGLPFKGDARIICEQEPEYDLNLSVLGGNFEKTASMLAQHGIYKEFKKKSGIDIGGDFNFSLNVSGSLERSKVSCVLDSSHLKAGNNEFKIQLPFQAKLDGIYESGYQCSVKTGKGKMNIRKGTLPISDLAFRLDYRPGDKIIRQTLSFNGKAKVVKADLLFEGSYSPEYRSIKDLRVSFKSDDMKPIADEISKIAVLNIPFTVDGGAMATMLASGPLDSLSHKTSIEISSVSLVLPMDISGSNTVLRIDNAGCSAEITKIPKQQAVLNLCRTHASILGGNVDLRGSISLGKSRDRYFPEYIDLNAHIADLDAKCLYLFLQNSILPDDMADTIEDIAGTISADISASGDHTQLIGRGQASLASGMLKYAGIDEPFSNIRFRFDFDKSSAGFRPTIKLSDGSVSFGRSRFSVSTGEIIDLYNQADISMQGRIEQAYPSDVMALLSGWKIPRIEFDNDWSFSGEINALGKLHRPEFDISLAFDKTELFCNLGALSNVDTINDSGTQKYLIPLEPSEIAFNYNLFKGLLQVKKCDLGLLGGKILIDEGSSTISSGTASGFKLAGQIIDVNLGSISGATDPGVKGIIGGTFEASRNEKGRSEFLMQLNLKEFLVDRLPVEPAIIDDIGLEFLASPDFRIGKMNLYLSAEGDDSTKGCLRIADGLFCGPYMRLEIDNSAFDPENLDIAAKVMFNPQTLRGTKLGRKMGKKTALLQDSATGIPYIDLMVCGSWRTPEMISRSIVRRAENRGKRNFIKKIFGGRRTHKASAEELESWFPGWTRDGNW